MSRRIRIPDKETFSVQEAAALLARALDVRADAARVRIYRAIQRQELTARRHLGTLRLPRAEVRRIVKGEIAT